MYVCMYGSMSVHACMSHFVIVIICVPAVPLCHMSNVCAICNFIVGPRPIYVPWLSVLLQLLLLLLLLLLPLRLLLLLLILLLLFIIITLS